MSGYTPTGPFVNNSPPGITFTFLNNVEAWIQQTEGDSNAVSVNGQTSGTATLIQSLQGTYKRGIVIFATYKNTATQTLVLPTAFTKVASITARNLNGTHIAFLSGGSAQTLKIITTLGLSGGTETAQNFICQWSFGECETAFDTVQIDSSASSAFTGILIFEGE